MNIIILPSFKRQLKPYLKKHQDLKEELIFCLENFDKKNAVFLGSNVYKIRLKIKNLNKGKNKSFRVLILLIESADQLIPISIFFKGDKENLSKKEINDSLEKALGELSLRDV